MDISVDGRSLPRLRSGTVEFTVGDPPDPPDPGVSRNVLILYGGVISYKGTPPS